MKRKMKMLIIVPWALLAMVITLLAIFVVPKLIKKEPVSSIAKYNDDISQLEIYKDKGIESKFSTDKYKLIFFVSSDCGSCMNSLPVLEKFNEILCRDQDLELVLLWENTVPWNVVGNYSLSDNSYSLNNVKIATGYNSVILADKANTVIFTDSLGYDNALSVIYDLKILNNETIKAKEAPRNCHLGFTN